MCTSERLIADLNAVTWDGMTTETTSVPAQPGDLKDEPTPPLEGSVDQPSRQRVGRLVGWWPLFVVLIPAVLLTIA